MVRVSLKDGNQFKGWIVKETTTQYTFQTVNYGTVILQKKNIREIKPVALSGDPWFYNPQSTHYFFQQSGHGLRKGEAYYRNSMIFINEFSYAFTDYVSLGAGVVPLFLFAGTPTPIWIKPNITIPVAAESFSLGAGAMLGSILGESASRFGYLYSQATLGNRDKNLSLGIGYGVTGMNSEQALVFTLSGFIRTGERGFIMTENYLIPIEDQPELLIMLGGRRLIGNFGLDYGFIAPLTGILSERFFIPWLGFSVPLN